MEKLSSTADWAPFRAAEATASRFPVQRPQKRERITMPAQIQDIAIFLQHSYGFLPKK